MALAGLWVQLFFGHKPPTRVETDSIGKGESPAVLSRVAAVINRAVVIKLDCFFLSRAYWKLLNEASVLPSDPSFGFPQDK